MQTKHVCVLIYIKIKGEAGTVKHIQALQYFLLTVPRLCFFCGPFLLFVFFVCLCFTVLSVSLQPCDHLLEKV